MELDCFIAIKCNPYMKHKLQSLFCATTLALYPSVHAAVEVREISAGSFELMVDNQPYNANGAATANFPFYVE